MVVPECDQSQLGRFAHKTFAGPAIAIHWAHFREGEDRGRGVQAWKHRDP